jgi:hypothetical protein
MKTLRTSVGPFAERPYYKDDEIERMCSDSLRETGFFPEHPGRIRIDRFIEKRFNVPIIYEEMPTRVLGFTEFGPKGVEAIHIAEPPAEERPASAERRMNSTLAHEAGHGLMHAHLFALDLDHPTLFSNDSDVTKTRMLCRDGEPSAEARPQRKYDGRWWELQANRAIGALLMPKGLFITFLEPFLERGGILGAPMLPAAGREGAVRAAAEVFDVNPAAVRIRIDLFFPDGRQLTL